MPEPQPGAERPAAGNTPAPPPSATEDREQTVAGPSDRSAVPGDQPSGTTTDDTGDAPTEQNPTGADSDQSVLDPSTGAAPTERVAAPAVPPALAAPDPTRVDRPAPDPTRIDHSGSAPVRAAVPGPPDPHRAPATPGPTQIDRPVPAAAGPAPAGPDRTRVDRPGPDPAEPTPAGPDRTRIDRAADPADEPDTPAPKWSGSAAVPPPRPKKRGWGHSAEPTPPPVPAPPFGPPEIQTPVDPWAGADTGGWDLNAAYEPLPPTRTYPTAPEPPSWSPPPAPPWSPPPVAPQPPPVTPVSGHPVPPVSRPVSPPPQARPVSPAAFPPPARPVSPPAYPPPVAAPQARPVSSPPPPPARPTPPAQSSPPARPTPPPVVSPPPRQRRTPPPPPVTPQQPQHRPAPQGYAPPPPRKRRRWPTRMLILTLLSIACCCGCPAYFGKPMWEQYPAAATLPAQMADLQLRTDARSENTARALRADVQGAHLLAEDTFAGVYATPQGKTVVLFGSTGFRLRPEADAETELTRLTPKYGLGEQQVVETDVRGQYQRCAVGRADNTNVVVCTWADHGSLATGLFTRLSLEDSATLLGSLREQVVTRE